MSFSKYKTYIADMYSTFEQLQTDIEKNGCLEHGCLNIVVCPKDSSHVCITVRVFCPHCFANNHLERLYNCRECDKQIQRIRETTPADEVKNKLGKLVCSHSTRIPINGIPFNSLGVHLCNMFKLGCLDHVQNKSVVEQLNCIHNSINNDSFNPFLSVNRFYAYLEMDMYTHALETAKYLDIKYNMNMESQFLEQEVEALKEGSALNELINVNSKYSYGFNNIGPTVQSSMRSVYESSNNNEDNDSILRVLSKRVISPDYEAMNDGEEQPRIPKSPTVSSEEYTIGERYDCIIEKKTDSNNKSVTRQYDIVDLFNGDRKALMAYNKFFNSEISSKDCESFAINCLIYFLNVKRRNESYCILKDAARFSYPLQYRFSNDGKESFDQIGNNGVSFEDMSN